METHIGEEYQHIAANRCNAWHIALREITHFLNQIKDKHNYKTSDHAINAFCRSMKYRNSRSNRILYCKNNYEAFRTFIKSSNT